MEELRRPTVTEALWRADEIDETIWEGREDTLTALVVGCPTARGRRGIRCWHSSGGSENETGWERGSTWEGSGERSETKDSGGGVEWGFLSQTTSK